MDAFGLSSHYLLLLCLSCLTTALMSHGTLHMLNGIRLSQKILIQITCSTRYPPSEIMKAEASAVLYPLGTSEGVYTCYQNLDLQHRQNGQAAMFLISVTISLLILLRTVTCIEYFIDLYSYHESIITSKQIY